MSKPTITLQELLNNGVQAQTEGNLAESKQLFQLALDIAKRARDSRSEASALLYLAGVVRQLDNDFTTAHKLLKESLKICRKISFDRGEAYALLELGTIAYQERKLDEGLDWMMQALTKFDQLQEKQGKARTLHQIGLIHKRKNDIEKAEREFRESLLIFESLKDANSMGKVLMSLGDTSVNYHNDLENGKLLFTRALNLFEQTGALSDIEKAKINLLTLEKLIRDRSQQNI